MRDFNSLGEFAAAVAAASFNRHSADPRLVWGAPTGLNTGVPSEGGFVVPEEFAADLIERVYNTGAILHLTEKFPMKSSKLAVPTVDEKSRAHGSRFGGVGLAFTEPGGSIASTKPTFGDRFFETNSLKGLCYVSGELLEDYPALTTVLERLYAMEAAFVVEDHIVNGSGAGTPLGVLESPSLITVAAESGQVAGTVNTENVIGMWKRLWVGSKSRAVWLVNPDITEYLLTLLLAVGTSTVRIAERAADGALLLLGRPVIENEYCPAAGSVGDIILGDFGEYLVGDRGGLNVTDSMNIAFDTDEHAFRFIWRMDGMPAWSSPTTSNNQTATVSPFVALAERA